MGASTGATVGELRDARESSTARGGHATRVQTWAAIMAFVTIAVRIVLDGR